MGRNILDHPVTGDIDRTIIVYETPLMCGNASYADNITILNRMFQTHIGMDGRRNQFANAFVIGDQQTFGRWQQLIYENPETYDWAIVNAGDLHFCMNTLDAGNKLEYPTIGGFAAEEMESTKEIKATGDAVLEFKHYDRFYQLVTVAAVKTLSDVVPAEFLFHPELLLDHCSANAGSFIFHHFRE